MLRRSQRPEAVVLSWMKQEGSSVEQDVEQGVPMEIVAADRAYDDTRNHYFSKVRGIESAIRLNDHRMEKKGPNRTGRAAINQKLSISGGRAIQDREKVWGSQARRWVRAVSLHGVAEVSHSGVHDGSDTELEEDGEAADRGDLQRQSERGCSIAGYRCARWGNKEGGTCREAG